MRSCTLWRPGEKLFEELFVPGESYKRTCHDKIFIATNASSFVPARLGVEIDALRAVIQRNDSDAILRSLQRIIPEFQPPQLADRVRSELRRRRVLVLGAPPARGARQWPLPALGLGSRECAHESIFADAALRAR